MNKNITLPLAPGNGTIEKTKAQLTTRFTKKLLPYLQDQQHIRIMPAENLRERRAILLCIAGREQASGGLREPWAFANCSSWEERLNEDETLQIKLEKMRRNLKRGTAFGPRLRASRKRSMTYDFMYGGRHLVLSKVDLLQKERTNQALLRALSSQLTPWQAAYCMPSVLGKPFWDFPRITHSSFDEKGDQRPNGQYTTKEVRVDLSGDRRRAFHYIISALQGLQADVTLNGRPVIEGQSLASLTYLLVGEANLGRDIIRPRNYFSIVLPLRGYYLDLYTFYHLE